ncbi:MAG: hypothetical protein P4L43_14690 [Syntrophobacteraceae bacterium]|nr:hypothetical protein [Syntrophobacteraceae bacterium]
MNGASLLLSVLFGAVGMAYLAYGKKQQELMPALAGIGLCAFPWFITNTWAMALVGAALIVFPWLL